MKKLIICIFMMIYSIFSYASPSVEKFQKEEKYIPIVSLEAKETFISELQSLNPAAYYIAAGRSSSFQTCDIRQNENECITARAKECIEEKIFLRNVFFSDKEIILFSYDIATDINRSLRN